MIVPLHTPSDVLHKSAFSDKAASFHSAMKHLLSQNDRTPEIGVRFFCAGVSLCAGPLRGRKTGLHARASTTVRTDDAQRGSGLSAQRIREFCVNFQRAAFCG